MPLPLLVVKCFGFTIFLLTAVISAGEFENFNCAMSLCNQCNSRLGSSLFVQFGSERMF